MRLLIAHDLSDHADQATDRSLNIPTERPIDVELVSVVSPPMAMDTGTLGVPVDLGPFLREEVIRTRAAMQAVAERIRQHDAVRSVRVHVPVGPPAAEIQSLADELECDCIVVGSIGHSAIERVFLGSVSDGVATGCDRSVLIIRPDPRPSESPAFHRIVASVSDTDEWHAIVDLMKDWRATPGVELHLVHVMDLFSFYRQDLRETESEIWQHQRERAERSLLKAESEIRSMGFETRRQLLEADHVGESLLRYAKEHDVDLIMTGDSHRSMFTRMLLGSTSRYVLRHASCSMLIARDPNAVPTADESHDRTTAEEAPRPSHSVTVL